MMFDGEKERLIDAVRTITPVAPGLRFPIAQAMLRPDAVIPVVIPLVVNAPPVDREDAIQLSPVTSRSEIVVFGSATAQEFPKLSVKVIVSPKRAAPVFTDLRINRSGFPQIPNFDTNKSLYPVKDLSYAPDVVGQSLDNVLPAITTWWLLSCAISIPSSELEPPIYVLSTMSVRLFFIFVTNTSYVPPLCVSLYDQVVVWNPFSADPTTYISLFGVIAISAT